MAFAGSPSRRHCIKTSTSLLTERFEDAFLLLFPSCTRERDRVIALSGRKVKDEKDREPFATFHDGRKFEKKEAKDRRRTKRFTFDSIPRKSSSTQVLGIGTWKRSLFAKTANGK